MRYESRTRTVMDGDKGELQCNPTSKKEIISNRKAYVFSNKEHWTIFIIQLLSKLSIKWA